MVTSHHRATLRASPPRRRNFRKFPPGAQLMGISTFVKFANAPQITTQIVALELLANLLSSTADSAIANVLLSAGIPRSLYKVFFAVKNLSRLTLKA
jgi:hypothetical protein